MNEKDSIFHFLKNTLLYISISTKNNRYRKFDYYSD